ncbi:hypothetical protein RRG08_059268 [Elysia crispata]|uniref:Uncharacterized protein n=1 Tax=Elysia crispata TaxID=231223 RepID=A0AAE0Y870_9GAST|nr:hypothetical protein RRG08_059268 [Elysia crispata]
MAPSSPLVTLCPIADRPLGLASLIRLSCGLGHTDIGASNIHATQFFPSQFYRASGGGSSGGSLVLQKNKIFFYDR